MAFDSITANAGSGGANFAFDTFTDTDAVSRTMPYSAIAFGPLNGAYTVVNTGAGLPVSIQNASIAVTAASLPLPTGAATDTKQDTGNTSLASIDGKTPALGQALAAASVPVVLTASQLGTLTPPAAIAGFATAANQTTELASLSSIDGKTPALGQALAAASVPVVLTAGQLSTLTPLSTVSVTGVSTAANQATVIASLASIDGHVDGVEGSLTSIDAKITAVNTGAVVVASSALPTGAATALRQDTGNTSLGSIDGKLPALGQALAAASVPVVLTASQLSTLTPLSTVAATQSGSWSLAANQSVNAAQINGVAPSMGNGVSGTGVQRVTIASDSTGQIALAASSAVVGHFIVDSGTITTVSTVTNLSQLGGTAIAMNTGVRAAGVQRVTICTDDVVPASQSGTWTVGISAAQTLATVTTVSTVTNLSQLGGTAIAMNTGVRAAGVQRVTICTDDVVPASQSGTWNIATVTNLSQLGGTAIAMNTGTRSAGTQRVTIATDDVVPASQSGTWTVQPGNTANSTPWLVTDTAATSGGLSIYHLVSANTTNQQNIKASAGQVYTITAFNINAAPRYLKFHNTAGTPTAGSGVVATFMIPGNTAGAGLVLNIDKGLAFSTGIAITVVTDITDAGATAVAASEIVLNIGYK